KDTPRPRRKANAGRVDGQGQNPGDRLNWNVQPRSPGRWNGCARSNSPTAKPIRLTRNATPALPTPFREPPKIDGLSLRSHATPPSANKATSTGIGPYIRDDAPKGRSNGKRNSRLPTSMRLPIN